MKLITAALVAAVLCSCATPPTVMHFDNLPPHVVVVVEDSHRVERDCRGGIYADGGGYVPPMADTLGCANAETGKIFISRAHPEVLAHEMAHLTGKKNPDEEGYAWPW